MIGTKAVHESVRHAIELAGRAPSIHNSQPWTFLVSDQRIDLYPNRERWLPITDTDQRDLLLSCGAALHHLRIGLAAGGLGASVRRLPDPATPDLLATVTVDGTTDDVDPRLSVEIPRRRSDRRPFRNYPIPEAFRRRLVERAAEQGAALRIIDDARNRGILLAAFAEAAEAQANMPGYTEELGAWTGRGGDDGIPAGNLERPVPPTVEAARDFGGQPESLDNTAPEESTLLLLGTASDDRLSQLRAGEAMSAVLLEATRHGLGSCPLSQPLEVQPTRNLLREKVLGGTLSPQIVIRIGWAQDTPLPTTPRRHVDETVASA